MIKNLKLNKNYGFSVATNIGIKQSDSPYILCLNDDAQLEDSYLSKLVPKLEEELNQADDKEAENGGEKSEDEK